MQNLFVARLTQHFRANTRIKFASIARWFIKNRWKITLRNDAEGKFRLGAGKFSRSHHRMCCVWKFWARKNVDLWQLFFISSSTFPFVSLLMWLRSIEKHIPRLKHQQHFLLLCSVTLGQHIAQNEERKSAIAKSRLARSTGFQKSSFSFRYFWVACAFESRKSFMYLGQGRKSVDWGSFSCSRLRNT